MVTSPTQSKTEILTQIAAEIAEYKGLDIARTATKSVPGEGNPDTHVMFIGEAPGYHEDQEGRPFVGAAGKLLEKALSRINLKRDDVYITNIVKFRPPDNRDPLPDEIAACASWLDRQITTIKPQIIATLGRFSMAKFLGPQSISRIHGSPRSIRFLSLPLLILPMFHPAAALRGTGVMQQFMADFDILQRLLRDSTSPPSPEPLFSPPNPPSQSNQTTLF